MPAALDGERVDRALAIITGLTRREVSQLLDDGRVIVGRRVVGSHSRRVREGESLGVEGDLAAGGDDTPQSDGSVRFEVLYQDAEVLVIDKPAGLVVHPGAGNREGTLVNGLLARFPDLSALAVGDSKERPGIVQRLDKGTSGLLLVARTGPARDSLIDQLSRRTVGREYLTLVAGHVDSDAGVVDAPLGRSDADPTRFRVQAGGRESRTRYEVLDRFADPASTLLRCRLETGRTHQIRVHLASIGHPVVGDGRYGSRSSLDRMLPAGRPFLHAAALEFDHPSEPRRLSFRSELPEDLLSVVRSISPTGWRLL